MSGLAATGGEPRDLTHRDDHTRGCRYRTPALQRPTTRNRGLTRVAVPDVGVGAVMAAAVSAAAAGDRADTSQALAGVPSAAVAAAC